MLDSQFPKFQFRRNEIDSEISRRMHLRYTSRLFPESLFEMASVKGVSQVHDVSHPWRAV